MFLINTKTGKVVAEGAKSALRKQKKGMKVKEQKDVKISKFKSTKEKEGKKTEKKEEKRKIGRKWTPDQLAAAERGLALTKRLKSIDMKLAEIVDLLTEEEEEEQADEEEEEETEDEEEEEEDEK